jgi:hypothetical protein
LFLFLRVCSASTQDEIEALELVFSLFPTSCSVFCSFSAVNSIRGNKKQNNAQLKQLRESQQGLSPQQ